MAVCIPIFVSFKYVYSVIRVRMILFLTYFVLGVIIAIIGF